MPSVQHGLAAEILIAIPHLLRFDFIPETCHPGRWLFPGAYRGFWGRYVFAGEFALVVTAFVYMQAPRLNAAAWQLWWSLGGKLKPGRIPG